MSNSKPILDRKWLAHHYCRAIKNVSYPLSHFFLFFCVDTKHTSAVSRVFADNLESGSDNAKLSDSLKCKGSNVCFVFPG